MITAAELSKISLDARNEKRKIALDLVERNCFVRTVVEFLMDRAKEAALAKNRERLRLPGTASTTALT